MSFSMPDWFWLICAVFGFLALFALLYPFFPARKKQWKMHLEDGPMERIRRGEKVVECRLDKPRWRGIREGHIVEFRSEDELRFVQVEVLEVVRAIDFDDLLSYFSRNGYLERPYEEQLERLEKRYPDAEVSKYLGVFGFRFRVPQ